MALIVAGAIIRGGRLLAGRRSYPPFEGLWELPGGKVETGEDDATALIRELAEELHVAARVGRRIGDAWSLADGHRMHVYLVAIPPDADPAPGDSHDEIRWLCACEFASVPWIPADLPIVMTVGRLLNATTNGEIGDVRPSDD